MSSGAFIIFTFVEQYKVNLCDRLLNFRAIVDIRQVEYVQNRRRTYERGQRSVIGLFNRSKFLNENAIDKNPNARKSIIICSGIQLTHAVRFRIAADRIQSNQCKYST